MVVSAMAQERTIRFKKHWNHDTFYLVTSNYFQFKNTGPPTEGAAEKVPTFQMWLRSNAWMVIL